MAAGKSCQFFSPAGMAPAQAKEKPLTTGPSDGPPRQHQPDRLKNNNVPSRRLSALRASAFYFITFRRLRAPAQSALPALACPMKFSV